MDNLKIGDTVYLKSGGPKMTIRTVASDGLVWCDWFDSTTPQNGEYHKDQLTNENPKRARVYA